MLLYSLRRLFLFTITLLLLTLISFSIMRLDFDAGYSALPFFTGWLQYIEQLLQGNFGISANGIPLNQQLIALFPATFELCFFAFLLAVLVGTPLGILAGLSQGYRTEKAISSITLLSSSIPIFWLAILLIMFFSLDNGWLPVSGRYHLLYEIPSITGFTLIDILLSGTPNQQPLLQDAFRHLLMPTIVLAIAPTTEIIRLLRDSVADVMTKNYIKAAATKGFSKSQIVRRHVIKNALPPVLPKFGLQLSTIMTFAIITESIFNWPGIGSWLLNSLDFKDYASVQAGVLAIGATVLFFNILFDFLSAAISPLVRKEWYAVNQ